ncbi:MAG: EAL domain-containing protein [Candidatus Phaeomarinobacter sp.]
MNTVRRWSTAGTASLLIATALCGVLLTLASYYFAKQTEMYAAKERFKFARQETLSAIEARMRAYESVLRSMDSAFAFRTNVTREHWHGFTEGLQINQHFPGIQALGYSEWVSPKDLAAYEAAVRAEGFPDFHIRPKGERDIYTSITIIEPMDIRNQQAFGYDMWSETTRQQAMMVARDTGEITITGPVKLKQEIDHSVQAGILMYMPHYDTASLTSVDARREANKGFLYGAFRMDDLMAGILGSEIRDIEIELRDITAGGADNMLFASPSGTGNQSDLSSSDTFTLYGRTWEMVSYAKPSLLARNGDISLPAAAILVSTSASLFVLILMFFALNTRQRAATIASRITRDLDERTNELSAALRRQVMIEDELRDMVTTDPLTGLANRAAFNVWLQKASNKDSQASIFPSGDDLHGYGVLMMDLDRFKIINDTLGHITGDELLCAVSARLRKTLPDDCKLARLGGDEFAIILPDDDRQTRSLSVAKSIQAKFEQPFACDNRMIKTTCSIGIAYIGTESADQQRAMSQADIALYRAKDTGRGLIRVFDEDLEAETVRRASVEEALDGALARGEFHLEYQPKLDSNGGRVVGAEALIRWVHPTIGFIPPDLFIQTAEETGRLEEISAWVLDTTCAQIRTWADDGITDIPIAINLSSQQLQSYSLVESITATLKKYGIAPEKLEIEITESMLINDFEQATNQLRRLRELGIKIALDDFGTGYSSLSYLHRLDVDVLKIDRSFVGSLDKSQSRSIVESIMTLAKTLNLHTVGEGVETLEQAQFLRANGCNEMQGWLFSKSLKAKDFEDWLRTDGTMPMAAKIAVV